MLTTQMDIKPFLHKKVVIVSEEWLSFCAYSRVFANLVQWFTYLMLLYVIVKSSPRVMGSYRWYIIWNVTHGILLSSYAVLMQPYPLTPYTIIVMRGLFKWIEIPDAYTRYITHIGLLIFAGDIYTTAFLFVFRWAQTTQNKFVAFLSNMKIYTLLYLLFLTLIVLFGVIPMHSQVMTVEQLKIGIQGVDPEVYELLSREKTVFGFNADDGNEHYQIGIICISIVGLGFFTFLTYCTISTYLYITKNKGSLHEKTMKLYVKLFNLLLMDLGIAVVLFFIPGVIFVAAQLLQLEWSSKVVSLGLIVVIFYPLSVNLLILFYIKPYRLELIYILQWTLFKWSGKRLGKIPAKKRMSLFSQSYA